MTSPLRQLSRTSMLVIADALERGRLGAPFTPMSVAHFVSPEQAGAVAAELERLQSLGGDPRHHAFLLRLLAEEREEGERAGGRVELVWTGPEVVGTASRDTYVVVREMFANARESILIAGYAVYQGKQVFQTLAERMDANPTLSCRMFLNIARRPGDERADSESLRDFAEGFRRDVWPGRRLPQVYYDPRALLAGPGPRASLHAKCIVVDDECAFVTSANFTEAAQERNIEAGVLVRDPTLSRGLRSQFESLLAAGLLRVLPGV